MSVPLQTYWLRVQIPLQSLLFSVLKKLKNRKKSTRKLPAKKLTPGNILTSIIFIGRCKARTKKLFSDRYFDFVLLFYYTFFLYLIYVYITPNIISKWLWDKRQNMISWNTRKYNIVKKNQFIDIFLFQALSVESLCMSKYLLCI